MAAATSREMGDLWGKINPLWALWEKADGPGVELVRMRAISRLDGKWD